MRELKELASHMMVDFLPMKSFAADPLILTDAEGIYITASDGRRYIDALSGAFCVNLGYGNRALAEVAAAQIRKLPLALPTLGTSDRALELVDLLLEITPPQYTTVKLMTGGSEATEAAIRMARQYHKQTGHATKYKVLSHYRSYHGATGNALSAGGWPSWRAPYEPLPGGFIHLHTPEVYQAPFPGTPATLGAIYARLVEDTITLEGPETIAALITEPIMMSAGVVVPPDDYLARLRELCDRYGIVLIYDEVITGFGRSGTLFAAEHWNAWPDVFCFGKGMTGAYAALSALMITEDVARAFWGEDAAQVHFQAGHTFGGNPVAAAVGKAAIRQVLDDGILENSRARGEQLQQRLRALQCRQPCIGDVRGKGLIVGVEFVVNPETRERYAAAAGFGLQLREAARRRGLLLRASHWMVAFGPPLITSAEEIDQIVDIFEEALAEVVATLEGTSDIARVPAAAGAIRRRA